METDSRRQKQEHDYSQQQQQQTSGLPTDEGLLDALLPIDLIITVGGSSNKQPRSSALTFEMPSGGPTHAKSPLHPTLYNQQLLDESSDRLTSSLPKQKSKLVKKHSKWGLNSSSSGGGSSNSGSEEEVTTPTIGARVELRRRPLPTFGTIQYVGPVCFAKGTWIGLELESRRKYLPLSKCKAKTLILSFVCLVGKNNGCVAGVRYFHTDPQRGLFVKQDDFTIISIPT